MSEDNKQNNRSKSLGPRYTKIKNRLINALKLKQSYDDADDILIDKICFIVKCMDKFQDDIEERGVQINVVRDPEKEPLFQSNPSINSFNRMANTLGQLLTKIGMTPQERNKLDLGSDSTLKKQNKEVDGQGVLDYFADNDIENFNVNNYLPN